MKNTPVTPAKEEKRKYKNVRYFGRVQDYNLSGPKPANSLSNGL